MKHGPARALKRIVPHLTVILALLCLLLFVLDRFNENMVFLANDLTKWMLAALCLCSMHCGVTLIAARFSQDGRRRYGFYDQDAVSIAPDADDLPAPGDGADKSAAADKPAGPAA